MKSILQLILLFSSYTFACDCPYPTIENSFASSDIVFTGKVISIDSSSYSPRGTKNNEYTFEVYSQLKGEKNDYLKRITLINANYSSCNFEPELNREYLIFGQISQTNFTTTLCKFNKELKDITKNELVLINELNNDFMNNNLYNTIILYDDENLNKIEKLNFYNNELLQENKNYKRAFFVTVSLLIILFLIWLNSKTSKR
ncbi:hypothetical protein HXZ94_08910 [Empedobacter falsenii]|uniref:hypothetical protein n=1 Tax=Empedobacter falsenii TaxID=343874 RepID=UPI002577E6E0|nr:hypothetical protein [Empedobacter falsenii]MDM1298621.1 hypothetical protein [Empedobacter falsenii]MDM1318414.1 hypothetical protein [Empedobacter falsenii]